MSYYCAITRQFCAWVGQGGKATLATAPDADILREIVCLLTQRVQAGRATFLIKVKSGNPSTSVNTLAEEGREISDDNKRWDDRTDRMTFEVQKGNTTVRSVLTNSVRHAFRSQAGWAKLQEVRATEAKLCRDRMRGDVEVRSYLRDQAGSRSLVFDLIIAHDRFGSSRHVQQNGSLSHPQDLDGPMRVAAQSKTNAYNQTYADNHI
jgi:hypothetical protein